MTWQKKRYYEAKVKDGKIITTNFMFNQKLFVRGSIPIIVGIIVAIVIVAGIAVWQSGLLERKITPSSTPTLSNDRKSIIANGTTLLVIDDDAIFNFFKTDSQLCDEANITTTPDRRMFCENRATFKSKTRFTSIVPSLDNTKVGFTIESDTLTPDKVVGIFYLYRLTNKIHFLTSYYLGNEFISFSPSGTNFIFQSGCFEAMCALYIRDSETLANKATLSDSEFPDARTRNATFVRWLSDNEVEYKLGTESKRASFSTTTSVTLLFPNGGERWETGKTYAIKWSSVNLPSDARIFLEFYGPIIPPAGPEEIVWRVPGGQIAKDLLSTQTSYSWKIPADIKPRNDYIIEIRAYWGQPLPLGEGVTYVYDISDAPFSIVAP